MPRLCIAGWHCPLSINSETTLNMEGPPAGFASARRRVSGLLQLHVEASMAAPVVHRYVVKIPFRAPVIFVRLYVVKLGGIMCCPFQARVAKRCVSSSIFSHALAGEACGQPLARHCANSRATLGIQGPHRKSFHLRSFQ